MGQRSSRSASAVALEIVLQRQQPAFLKPIWSEPRGAADAQAPCQSGERRPGIGKVRRDPAAGTCKSGLCVSPLIVPKLARGII